MRKQRPVFQAPTLIGCMALAGLVACGGDKMESSSATGLPEVAVVELRKETVEIRREWQGVLTPLRTFTVTAPEAGEMVALEVSDGQIVQAGDLLARMDGPELSARQTVLNEREEALRGEWKRWRRLAEAGAAGPSEVESAKLRLLEVEESLAGLEARLRALELRAPITGVISGLLVSSGSNVSAGDTILNIQNLESLGVRLRLPARERTYLDRMAALVLETGANAVLPIQKIVSVETPLIPLGYTDVEVWVGEIPEASKPVSREATLIYRIEREVVLLPWTSVAREGDDHWIAVVKGDPETVERRRVRLGTGQANGIEVVEGVDAGERVLRYEPRSQPEGAEVLARLWER